MNIFKQLIVSLYSPKDISTFRNQGIGKTILYVFFLTFISLLPSFYFFSTTVVNDFQMMQTTVQNDLPSFTIENGELSSEEKAPITINKDDFTIMFDSTGTVTSDDAGNTNNSIYILKNEVIYTFAGQSQSLPYTVLEGINLTKEDVVELTSSMESFLPIFIPIVLVIIYLLSSVGKFIGVFFLALIGLILNNTLRRNLTYGRLWRLAAYSITLPTIFFMIMEALRTIVPSGFLIYWLVAIIMLVLVLKEIPSQEAKEE
ncbi:DUF1189 domain-containing protein [Niallia sp. Krafla_26]|uniref:DUF1189 domain-containing protein n=1 Tax=Niallia sp. Krafla_26 TaxID=3064703 RepID=UPI003D1663B9